MSSGQSACADAMVNEARAAHKERLEKLGIDKISSTVEDIEVELCMFERDLTMLSRRGWGRLDRIKELVARLG